jgi:hypothetical protein
MAYFRNSNTFAGVKNNLITTNHINEKSFLSSYDRRLRCNGRLRS